MGLGWDKNKFHNQDSMWTSYSDLFLGLSVVFLLLYVTASLRQGTDGIKQHIDNQQLTRENEDLKQQLKVYNSLKQNYLDTEASQDEQKTYEVLMDKLNMLKDEAKTEKSKLEQQAEENGKKEMALNQYQQTIRNIINANLLSKSRIKNRDTLLTKHEDTIEGQSKELTEKRAEIEQSQNKIAQLDNELQKKLKQLKRSYKEKQLTERAYQKRQEALKAENEKKVAALASKAQQAQQDLAQMSQQLTQTSTQLQQVGLEKNRLEGEVGKMKSDFEAQKASDRKKFEAALAKEQLSGKERAAREAQYRAESERKEKELGDKIAAAEGKYKATAGDLAKTKGELAKAEENLNARKKLASSIEGMFKANGVKAEVDGKTGDVLLSFDGEYFDTGASKLKPGMKNVLEKAMPAYAQSLFKDPKIAEKIENVEIVGYASPTYNGKYVDPSKLSGKDREAVNYNLDLSYSRARAIFDHMLTKMQFDHKQKLLPLVKVTGRSFLSDKKDRDPAGSDAVSEFCKKQDCAKQQTVVIKFKLRD